MKTKLLTMLTAIVLLLPALAIASPVDVAFTGVGTNTFGGAYTYPYYAVVYPGFGAITVACDSYDLHSDVGSTWTADAINLTGGNITGTQFEGDGVFSYEEMSWLYKNYVKNGADPINGNVAMWMVFASDAPSDPTASAYLAQAATHANLSSLNGVYVFTATGVDNHNQEFVYYTPEPASLMLLGSGILGIAVLLRKRMLT